MVSRTSRQYQSQPRPRTTGGRQSFESSLPATSSTAWDRGVVNNENVRTQPQLVHQPQQRRAQSTMRYSSNGRSSLGGGGGHGNGSGRSTPRMMMDPPQKLTTQNARSQPQSQRYPAGNMTRPRAVSVGRVRAPIAQQQLKQSTQQQQQQQQQRMTRPKNGAEDPNEVARNILDLRERREASGGGGAAAAVAAAAAITGQTQSKQPRRSMEPPTRSGVPGLPQSRSNLSDHSNRNRKNGAAPSSQPTGRSNPSAGPSKTATNGTKSAGSTQDDPATNDRLKRAESKISGLIEELEELKFFQELEDETPSGTTPKTPNVGSSSGNGNVSGGGGGGGGGGVPNQYPRTTNGTPRHAAASSSQPLVTPRERAISRGREGDRAPSRGRNDNDRTAGIPLNIRTPSPARVGRLPPPPPVNVNGGTTPRSAPINTPMAKHLRQNGNSGGLQTYNPLSPRAIAKLDRNALELECQTLVRKLQIIEQERNSKSAMVEMYEISLQDHDADKIKIQKLQGELGKVSGELKRQLHNVARDKESLVREYEERLQNNLAKLQRVQEKADSYKMDLEVTQEEARRAKQQAEGFRNKAREENMKLSEQKGRESHLEMQLQEARQLNASLVQKVDSKREELSSLQNDLTETAQQLRDQEVERNQAFNSEINALRDELSQEKDKYAQMEQNLRDRDDRVSQYESQLDMAQVKEAEQNALISELQSRSEELEKMTIIKFEEGKKASKSAETKKMQELVSERANQSREYERRIKAMQEQLRHQADRHHAEIQETRRRNDERLESMREEIRSELQMQEGEKILKLETELSVLRRTYEESKDDYTSRLKESQQKSRDIAADFQRQDEVRQQELDSLQGRLTSCTKDLSLKEEETIELSTQLETTQKALKALETYKVNSQSELMKKDDLLEELRDKLSTKEIEHNTKVDAMKAEFDDLAARLREENHELQEQIDETQKQLSDAKVSIKDGMLVQARLEQTQNALMAAESSIQDEKLRHNDTESDLRSELASMEGKLRASESSVMSKKNRIQELEKEIEAANAASTKLGEEKDSENELLKNQLQNERKIREEKESDISDLESKLSAMKEKLETMNKIEDAVIDLKRKAAEVEYELKQKDAELTDTSRMYEETKSKLLDAEQKYSEIKSDFENQVSKKEKLMERYEKSMKELEIKLQKEHDANIDYEMNVSELKRSVESMERQKVRKDTELTNLRKDYEDLSSLLEENLHSSAKKDDLDVQLKRREREMKEAVDMHNHNVAELEAKLNQSEKEKELVQADRKKMQNTLDDLNDEKLKLRADLSSLKKKYDSLSFELESLREQTDSIGGVEAELSRKDRQMRDVIQRYTRNIADLEDRLEEETQSKAELEDCLASTRSELDDKQKYLEDVLQKHSKATRQLESDLSKTKFEKDELETKFDQTKRDLEQKRKELKTTVTRLSSGVSKLQSVQNEQNEYRQISESTRDELERKSKQISELKQKIPELLSELQTKNRETEDAKASSKRLEVELNKRKDQYNEAVKRYSEQINILESELGSRSHVDDKFESTRLEAKNKDKKIRELEDSVMELETKLEIAQKNKESAKQKADSVTRELDEKESESRRFEMEKIELETKLQSQLRTKDELRSKVSELSSKLERKEREIREVTDRNKMYVMELEARLDQDTDAKHQMQIDIDRLKNELNSAVEVSSEAAELRDKVFNLESEVDRYRSKSLDSEYKSKEGVRLVESQLEDAKRSRDEVEEALSKAQGEKAEVIAALEGVINEVQNREDEIESLSELLHRRDEELEHAKIIATKALQSAKDIQKRFKDRDKTQQSELTERMDELSDSVDTLTSKNDTLQRKIGLLERDLREKTLECERLKDQLGHFDENTNRNTRHAAKDDNSAFTHSTFASSGRTDSLRTGSQVRGGSSMDPEGLGAGSDFFSGSEGHSPVLERGGFADNAFDEPMEFPAFEQKISEDYSDGGPASTINSHEFEGDNRSTGFESIGSEHTGRSRKSIERDALRKYVRQRYMSKR